MYFAALFLVSAFATVAHAIPSARTFGSSPHLEHGVATHHHAAHQHQAFPGAQHPTANHGQHVLVENDASVSVLVCQVVKVPVGQPGTQPAVPAAASAGSPAVAASSVISSSQDALSNLQSSVRIAVDRLVDPVVAALQNASLWLNRTSQLHLNQSHHHSQHQHGGQANHEHAAHNLHEHHHGGLINQHATHGHQIPQTISDLAVPMTVVSVPVLVPAVHAGSFPLVNLSAVVPAAVDVASLQFSNAGPENATSSFTATAASVPATTQPASTPANVGLVGRTGALTTAPGTDAPATLASDMLTSTAVFDISTLSVGSENIDALGRQFPPPVVHRPVCPYDCVPPELRR